MSQCINFDSGVTFLLTLCSCDQSLKNWKEHRSINSEFLPDNLCQGLVGLERYPYFAYY